MQEFEKNGYDMHTKTKSAIIFYDTFFRLCWGLIFGLHRYAINLVVAKTIIWSRFPMEQQILPSVRPNRGKFGEKYKNRLSKFGPPKRKAPKADLHFSVSNGSSREVGLMGLICHVCKCY